MSAEISTDRQKTNFLSYLQLFIAILAVSFAAPLVVLLQQYNVPPEVTAMYRTLFAGILALIISTFKGDIHWIVIPSTRKRFHWILISGLLLAIHFATWFLSLQYVSVAVSTTLVDTVPIFMAIFGFIFFREKINWVGIIGILIAFIGGVFLAIMKSEENTHVNPLLGVLFALIGALSVTFYFLIGKKILSNSPLWPYFGLVNIISGLVLMIYNLVRGYSFLYSFIVFLYIIFMTLGPSLIGHATYNYSLRRLPAFVVGTVIVAEPIGATILGIIFLEQLPNPIIILYAFIILIGIVLTSLSNNLDTIFLCKKVKKENKI